MKSTYKLIFISVISCLLFSCSITNKSKDEISGTIQNQSIINSLNFIIGQDSIQKLMSIGQHDKVFTMLSRRIEDNPQLWDSHFAMGIFFLDQGRKNEGISEIKTALHNIDTILQSQKDKSSGHYAKALTLKFLGDKNYKQELDLYKQSCKYNPNSVIGTESDFYEAIDYSICILEENDTEKIRKIILYGKK